VESEGVSCFVAEDVPPLGGGQSPRQGDLHLDLPAIDLPSCLQLLPPADRLGRKLRLRKPAAARQEKVKALDRGQLSALLAAALDSSPRLYPLFLTLARSGLRLGEALALRWEDLDLERREIRVAQAITRTRVISTPKSGHGRTVDMSAALRDVLQRHRQKLLEEAVAHGVEVAPWVFPSMSGQPLDHNNVNKAFKRMVKTAGLPLHHSPHDLRHTLASLLLQQGESPAYVQRQLGHASIQLTVDTYGKWLPMGNKAAVDRLDERLPDEVVAKVVAKTANAPRRRPERLQVVGGVGAPRAIRTPDLQIRSH